MVLKNKYVFGTLVQFYELEMLEEHIRSCAGMLADIENKENVTFVFRFSTQEYLEKIDWEYFNTKFPSGVVLLNDVQFIRHLFFETVFGRTDIFPAKIVVSYAGNDMPFHNIAAFRRDFTWEYSDKADIILWGETDSLWPSQTLTILDTLHNQVKDITPKYIFNFADRKLWDNSFAPLHPMYENVQFIDDDKWQFEHPASGKSYMDYETMEKINEVPTDVEIVTFNIPRFDGSCVAFSSDLLCSGVTLPKSLILHSEDVAIGRIAKKLMGDEFIQYNAKNILHVHNRRHPRKRTGILNENNFNGKCTVKDKGQWWGILEESSKANYYTLFDQKKVFKLNDVMDKIKLNEK